MKVSTEFGQRPLRWTTRGCW